MMENIRKEFEDAVIRDWDIRFADLTRNDEGYAVRTIDSAWWAWKTSREYLAIELPHGRYGPAAMTNEILGWNRAYDACKDSIHAAGIRTK